MVSNMPSASTELIVTLPLAPMDPGIMQRMGDGKALKQEY